MDILVDGDSYTDEEMFKYIVNLGKEFALEQFINGIKVGILVQKHGQVDKLCENLKRVQQETKKKIS